MNGYPYFPNFDKKKKIFSIIFSIRRENRTDSGRRHSQSRGFLPPPVKKKARRARRAGARKSEKDARNPPRP